LTVVKEAEPDQTGRKQFKFQCQCGNFVVAPWGTERSCGCANFGRDGHRKQLEHNADYMPYWVYKKYASYRSGAKNAMREFTLTKDEFTKLITSPCFYCGDLPKPPEVEDKSIKISCAINGIDRVDNNEGYTPDNAVPCCKICQEAKMDRHVSVFLAWIEKVHAYQAAKRG